MSPPIGWKHSAAAIAKIGNATRRRFRDPAYRENLVRKHTGRRLSAKWRRSISQAKALPLTAAERKLYATLCRTMSRKEALYQTLKMTFCRV